MVTTGKIVIRIVFVVCVVLVLITDYSGLIHKLIGGNRTDEAGKVPPRPKNPGYGDPKTDIDIDADIEDDTIKNLGKYFQKYMFYRLHYLFLKEHSNFVSCLP